MSFVLWDESLDVGVAAFNNDHKRLVEFINELHSAMITGLGISKMTHVLDGLIDYTRNHFKREEELMLRHGYPGYGAHRAEHEKLVATVMEFHDRLGSGKSSFSLELMSFLKDWLINHIKGTDMKYREFFATKGGS
jgi:hemerythrin